MLKLHETEVRTTEYLEGKRVLDEVAEVCRWLPPLWDLENYVAVNPFLGFTDRPLEAAAVAIGDGIDAEVLPGLAFYRERWQAGAFGPAELAQVARRAGYDLQELLAILEGTMPLPLRNRAQVLTFAERYDQAHGTRWHERAIRHATLWCSVYIPQDGPQWARQPAQRLYAAWRAAASEDRSLELAGMPGWCAWVRQLPTLPEAAIELMLGKLQLAPTERTSYLYRLLGGVFGWASSLRREVWAAGDHEPGPLLDLLAMRMATDAAVALLLPHQKRTIVPLRQPAQAEDETVRMILQEALEDGYTRQLLGKLKAPTPTPLERPAVQAAFCIDVRSEILRRHFEAQSPAVETLGFAGFFAVFLDWQTNGGQSSARCPVLLQPGVKIAANEVIPLWSGQQVTKKLTASPGAAFTFVETLGLVYALGLAGDALGVVTSPRHNEEQVPFYLAPEGRTGVTLENRIAIAALILKNMGLRERYGRLVLLAGHEGCSENNPHQAGLDCGACGGHGGAINARIAAAILNDPGVRAALPSRGFQVPTDTHFLPGVHDTSTDEVRLLDLAQVPATHHADLAQLQQWLKAAGSRTRAERAEGLGLQTRKQRLIDRLLRKRARDWSEARPEWALARNAAFIVARRSRTRGVSLEGRTFLHEYDWTTDPDNSILTLILTAPMVVASWINLQYFGSTVSNDVFGCGTKTLHNRIGTLGVVLGNGGDLRTGLALQSVHDTDGRWYHEPLRLQVVVEAPRERIEAVLAAHQNVRELVEHGWIRLFVLDPDSNATARWLPGQGWA
ncbi:MAG: DUF2309 domain-containing protein [Chloroflexia bacterium]|nr:DUF2309 domain-containing protein [Chloroflexia bacterium]